MRRQCVLEPVGERRRIERCQRRGGQIRAREGDAILVFAAGAGADLVIKRVVSRIIWDQRVDAVITAVQEYAHQRLVIAGVEGRGFADGGEVDRQRRRHAQRGEVHGTLQDDAASPEPIPGGFWRLHFCTR